MPTKPEKIGYLEKSLGWRKFSNVNAESEKTISRR